jgi:hypothetical protein
MTERTIQTTWYRFSQNNSGGSFQDDPHAGIGYEVWIEAISADAANARAEGIGIYFDGDGDCSCCGNRWSEAWSSEGRAEAPTEVRLVTDWDCRSYAHPLIGEFYEIPSRVVGWSGL